MAFERLSPLRPGAEAVTRLSISAQHFTLAEADSLGRRSVGRGLWRLWVAGADGGPQGAVQTIEVV